LINFKLRMIGSDMAGVAGFWFSCLFQAVLMAQVAFLTLAYGFIGSRFANIMTAITGEFG